MKTGFFSLAFWGVLAVAVLGDPPVVITGNDIVANIKLVVRANNGEKLTENETGRVQLMVAYLSGYIDGLHPLQTYVPQGPVSLPDDLTIGQFAKNLDQYMTDNPDSLKDPSALVLFNCACTYYKNPNFMPGLMPQRVPLPDLTPKK